MTFQGNVHVKSQLSKKHEWKRHGIGTYLNRELAILLFKIAFGPVFDVQIPLILVY